MKRYICKLCTDIQMLFQSRFCLIIVQKLITAFARIRPPAGLRSLPGCWFHRQTPHYFFAPPPCVLSTCIALQAYRSGICDAQIGQTMSRHPTSALYILPHRMSFLACPSAENIPFRFCRATLSATDYFKKQEHCYLACAAGMPAPLAICSACVNFVFFIFKLL